MGSHLASGLSAYALMVVLAGAVLAALPVSQPSYASHENISVEVDRVTYGTGDDVVITGVIENIEEGEDVSVRVSGPAGTETNEADLNEDTGDYSLVYRIGNSDDDGLYTVRITYNGESVYSYFIVDEDSDPVSVLLDSESYEAGSDVEIIGEVDDLQSGITEVEITIFDPTNDEILDSEDVDLDDDEYSYTYELESDAPHGRYAVFVTYNDADEGSAIFDIEDEDGGSNNNDEPITIDVDSSYKPGDTVEITGEVENVEAGEDQVEIIVTNPDNNEIVEEDVELQNDGSFEFEFDLTDDTEEGEYTITVSYNGDEAEATFDVSEDGTSSGGSSSSGLTVNLNKSSYLAGETMTVSGKVPKKVNDAVINIDVFDAGSFFAGSFATAEPDSDLSYSATLRLSGELDVDDGYVVSVNYGPYSAEKEFSITGQSSVVTGGAITVNTDSDEYDIGSTIRITGRVNSDSLVEGEKILIKVNKPDGNPYRIDIVDPSSSGSYTYDVVIGGDLAIPGEYEVVAVYNQKEATTEFELVGEQGMSAYNLRVEDENYPIEYEVSGGEIKSMFVRPGDNKLVVSIDATEDGQLILVLPREVIDSAVNGSDTGYLVSTTDLESGANDDVDISESETTNESRTVVIDYKAGTDLIEISGTSVVPEFGAVSAIVLAVAIVGIIVATARMQKFSFFK